MFLLKKILAGLVLPPASLLLLAGLGLWLARRRPRLGAWLAGSSLLALALLSTPWLSGTLLRTLETSPPIDAEALAGCQAIVILGAGTYRAAPEYGGDTVNRLALERLRYGARLARQSGLPVAVTGGTVYAGRPEAESMRQALVEDFAVAVRWTEDRSRDTAENAAFLAPLLAREGVRRVALVTHAWHMPRARALFERHGLAVEPAPTGFTTGAADSPLDWLPGAGALNNSRYALHEWLGRWFSGHFTPVAPARP
jgi:uncharacterized SAM-binding protein YcdF (DUF218 family)